MPPRRPLLAGAAALVLACGAPRSGSAPAPAPGEPVPTDRSVYATDPPPADDPGPPAPAVASAQCHASADCTGRSPVRCVGDGEGRCVARDRVGCGFIPTGGELQARCCDGTATCNPDAFAP